MRAFINTEVTKRTILKQLKAHASADEIVKGQYWEDSKGCAVGCTIHSENHAEYEPRFGIPEMLARLEDCIFEGLPNGKAKEWPIRFMSSVRPGSYLSLVGWKFMHWLITDEAVNPGINHPIVRDAVKQCSDLLTSLIHGEAPSRSAVESAVSAAWSAESAALALSTASAESAESAAWSARSAAASAMSMADAVESAVSAAWSAESAAWSARASAARSAAESEAWVMMADKLIELIEKAP